MLKKCCFTPLSPVVFDEKFAVIGTVVSSCIMCHLSLAAFRSFPLFLSVQFSHSVVSDSMDYSTPGLPVHHQLLEFTQTHVHWVGDAIQPSHPLLSPSPPALNLCQHQGLFKWVSSSQQAAKVLVFSNLMVIGLVNYGGSSYSKFTMLLEFVCMSVRKLGMLSCIISLNIFLHYPFSSLRT